MHLKKLITVLLVLFLSFSMLGMLHPVIGQPVDVNLKAVSDVSELGDPVTMPDVVGTTFSVAVVVEDTNLTSDMKLYGFDVQFNWTTEWITYTGYTVTVPVDDYPSPIPPSPYAGILWAPTMKLKEAVDESASIPSAEPGTMAWIGYSSMAGAPPGGFNGSGTICVFNFVVHNQPYSYEENATIKIHFIKTSLSDPVPTPIAHNIIDLEIPLYVRKFAYPPSPMLKVTPANVVASSGCLGKNFTETVSLLGADGGDLDSFWDVAGCDFYLNFNATMIEALSITIDPYNDFGAFWADGTFELMKEINNTAGYAHIAFVGLGGTHTPVFGTLRVAEVTFNMTYEHVGYPPPSAPIYLENPLVPSTWYIMDADGGLIDMSAPVPTNWTTVFPYSMFPTGFSLDSWEDVDGDGQLSVGDQIIMLNKDTLKTHDYYVDHVKGTLKLTQQPFQAVDDYLWATDSITEYGLSKYCGLPGRTTASFYGMYDGMGHPYWTGNFSVTYPFVSVNSVTANFVGNGTSKVLTEGVDYKVYPGEDKIELLTPIDVDIINECWVDNVNNSLNGWPFIGYTASSIQSVYVKFPNGTERYATGGLGYFESPPPAEWWYEPDYPCELEGWWVLGYLGHEDPAWPSNSTWWINYTAVSYLTVDYNAEPDPRPYYMEFEGDYAEFLALDGNLLYTLWDEAYPRYGNVWNVTAWTDTDSSGDITASDMLTMELDGLVRDYQVDAVSTDIKVIQKPCVQDVDPTAKYYTDPIIVDIAGFPHPERSMSPWFSRDVAIPLPNEVENAMYTSCYKVLGRQIDVYTQYPDPYGGQGPNKPSDMFWPQKEVRLFANVTYNLWPEQQKDVTFEVKDPYGVTYVVLQNRTDEYGVARVSFRLPWKCDYPEYYFGEWKVIATVDVACQHINDTMAFKYDYMVHIWKVTTDASSYAHGETINVTIEYGSAAMQTYDILLAISGLDETGVPFDYNYVWVTVGGAQYCTYANGTASVTLYIPKWARAGKATIHVSALWPGLPQLGGVPEYPLVTTDITIRAE